MIGKAGATGALGVVLAAVLACCGDEASRESPSMREILSLEPGTLVARFEWVDLDFPLLQLRTLPPAWGDYDNDGDLDLPLFRNEGNGTFSEIPGFRTLVEKGNYHGVAWGDYNQDGFLDVVLLTYGSEPSLLLHNNRDGTFVNVGPALGIDVVGYGEQAVWGDFDGDGDLDLFAPYYSHVAPFRSFLYQNNGDGTFSEVAVEAGVSLPGLPLDLRPEGAHAADVNGDGALDIYCAHHFFLNLGNGRFEDVREQVGLPILFDEGATFVDYDNDGDLDLYLRAEERARLFRYEAGRFTEITLEAGLGASEFAWGDSWADVDNDGDLDLLSCSWLEPSQLYLNQGNGTFQKDQGFAALDIRTDNSAWGDYDDDGDLDLVIGNNEWWLYRNRLDLSPGFRHSYLRVEVLDSAGCRTQHGATVRMRRTDGEYSETQTRIVSGGSTYLSQSQYAAHFAVVPGGTYELEVVFPSRPGQPLILNRGTQPKTIGIVPGLLKDKTIRVYRDLRIEIDGEIWVPRM